MRRIAIPLLVLVLVLLIGAAYLPCRGEQLPAPKTEALFPGITRIVYANQTFVFTTTVKLSATFESVVPGEIRIRVRANYTPREGMTLAPGQVVRIYWEDGDETLYDGMPPDGEWTGVVLTEGGLTEK